MCSLELDTLRLLEGTIFSFIRFAARMFQRSRILLTFWSLMFGIDDSSIDLVRYVAEEN